MPKLGLTMTEGTLTEWLVEPGVSFKAGTVLYIVESDKVANEIEAEADGALLEVVLPAGETVEVGTVIGYWDAAAPSSEPQALAGATPRPSVDEPTATRRPVTPYARRRARELGVDLAWVRGTGPNERIQARDVETAAARDVEVPACASGGARLVRPTATQQAMARRLALSKPQVPHFYLALEAEVSALLALRAEFNASNETPRLTLNHLIVAAVGRALRDIPHANRVWTDEGIVQYDDGDVGIAVDTDRGLLVPVLRDAGRLSLAELARRAGRLVDKARSGGLVADEMGGGAITVSNAGMLNVTYMTPIINPGQAMILGVGSVRELFRPDAQGRPALRRELGLVLAADHRIQSGAPALRFLNEVVRRLEQPAQLLTE